MRRLKYAHIGTALTQGGKHYVEPEGVSTGLFEPTGTG